MLIVHTCYRDVFHVIVIHIHGKCFLAVPITVIASFRKMKKLTQDSTFIVAALRESSILVRSFIFSLSFMSCLWNLDFVDRKKFACHKFICLNLQVVNSDGKKVKRLDPFHFAEVKDPKVF